MAAPICSPADLWACPNTAETTRVYVSLGGHQARRVLPATNHLSSVDALTINATAVTGNGNVVNGAITREGERGSLWPGRWFHPTRATLAFENLRWAAAMPALRA